MKSILLYYPFKMAKNANSGSKLRPKEIYRAFLEWGKERGIEILLISGDSREREELFNRMKSSGSLNNLLFCYMENQTIPLWLTDPHHFPKRPTVDLKVMEFLKKRKIPLGVFYRDVYWKFDELYPLKGIKKFVMQSIYRMEEKFYEKYCDVIFLPSDAMARYVNIKKPMVALPPGGKSFTMVDHRENNEIKQGLYVGGINNEDYGLFLLLDSLNIANSGGKICDLTVVCRLDEYEKLPDDKKVMLGNAGVSLKHVSGEELNQLYKEMDFAFIPRYKSTYNDFSVPVKLVEYLSNGLPVIATNCDAQRSIIESGGYGLICEDNTISMAQAILEMTKVSNQFRCNIQENFANNHSWSARVKQVEESLIKEDI